MITWINSSSIFIKTNSILKRTWFPDFFQTPLNQGLLLVGVLGTWRKQDRSTLNTNSGQKLTTAISAQGRGSKICILLRSSDSMCRRWNQTTCSQQCPRDSTSRTLLKTIFVLNTESKNPKLENSFTFTFSFFGIPKTSSCFLLKRKK